MECEGCQMSADNCHVAEIWLWSWKEGLCLCEIKILSLRELGFSDALEQLIGLQSAPCYCISGGLDNSYSAPWLEVCCSWWLNGIIVNLRPAVHLSCCAGYRQITSMAGCFLITVRVCSVTSTQYLMHWYFSTLPVIFPSDSFHVTLLFVTPSFPPPVVLINQWWREEGWGFHCSRQEESWEFSGSCVWMKRTCLSSLIASRCSCTGAPMLIERKIAAFFPSAVWAEELWELYFRDHMRPDGL